MNTNKIISFRIFRGEDGFYVASAEDFGIVTQGKTMEELIDNIREATSVSLDDETNNGGKCFIFPPVMMNIDLAEMIHA